MGVFGPNGLSTRNVSYTGQAIANALNPGDHTTIDCLVADAANYEFVLHPGDFAYAGESVFGMVIRRYPSRLLALKAVRRYLLRLLDAWLKEEVLGYINGTFAQGPQVYEGLNEIF
jgi:hypothetical protein